MNYTLFFKKLKTLQDLNSKSSDKIKGKIMRLRKIIKIDCQKLESNANMLSKNKIVLHSNNVVFVFRIVIL